jgi:hypothetical protein
MRSHPRHLVSIIGTTLLLAAGCAHHTSVDSVPIGTNIEVTRHDGGVIEGRLTARNPHQVSLDVGAATRWITRSDIADVHVVNADQPDILPLVATYRELTLPAGTRLAARLETTVSSASSDVGDPVEATLLDPITIDDHEAVPAGSVIGGEVASVERSGRVRGRARLALTFGTLHVVSRNDAYPIAARIDDMAPATKREDAGRIGLPAAGGAILGAIIGGGKGAAIGAAVGATAGTATVLATRGRAVTLPRGTMLHLRLEHNVTVRVPIHRVNGSAS